MAAFRHRGAHSLSDGAIIGYNGLSIQNSQQFDIGDTKMTTCPLCGREYQDTSATCPSCSQGAALASATVPFPDQDGIPTMLSTRAESGNLSEDKKYVLVVVSGNDPGKIFPIEKPRVTIGRMGCDINLEDLELSRQHALVAIRGTSARLEDLDSTNGTFLNEERVSQAVLDDRTEFRLGNHVLMFLMTDRELP